MAERPDQIVKHIETMRNELGTNLQELEDKVKEAADWKTYFEKTPFTFVGLAFGGGVLLAASLGGFKARNGTSGRSLAAPRQQVDRSSERARDWRDSSHGNQMLETWETLKGALIGYGAQKIRAALDETLPGFGDQFEKAEREKSVIRSPRHLAREPELESAHRV